MKARFPLTAAFSIIARPLGPDRRGAVALLIGLLLLPLMVTAGLAVDLSRAYLVQSRLITATDAAALAAAKSFYEPTRDQRAEGFFWANFGREKTTSKIGYMDSLVDGPRVVQVSATEIEVSAAASMPTTFLKVIGYDTIDLAATNVAQRAERGMELALVLDVTGSMRGSKLQALREAATSLVDMLYGTRETTENLWMSVVPYVASVNIGPGNTSWLRTGSLDPNNYLPKSWKGCVEARHEHGNDMNELNPYEAPFEPFLWKSTYRQYPKGGSRGGYYIGDNDWTATSVTEDDFAKRGNDTTGPNLSCPPPIMPLRQAKEPVKTFIQSLEAHSRGGTMANVGLQAAWFTLSPRWRGLWGDPKMPLDYDTPQMDKVVILMTDGVNQWYDWPDRVPGRNKDGRKDDEDADYTAYGRFLSNRLKIANLTESNATKEIDSRMLTLCNSMKARNIEIYTITFAVASDSTKKLFQSCASSPTFYYNSPDETALKAAFKEIADQLLSIRLNR